MRPAIEPTSTSRPQPAACMRGKKARATLIGPRMLTLKIRSTSCSQVSGSESIQSLYRVTPAVSATPFGLCPSASSSAATASTAARSAMSQALVVTVALYRSSMARAGPEGSFISASTSLAPWAAQVSATERPIPCCAPRTSIVRPSRVKPVGFSCVVITCPLRNSNGIIRCLSSWRKHLPAVHTVVYGLVRPRLGSHHLMTPVA